MFWTSIQGSAFLFFRIFTSPLNSLYLYSFGGLFFSGWKRNSFFPLSPPSWLSLSSPLSSPPLIPSSPPLLLWISLFSLLLLSITVPSHPLFSPVLTSPLSPFLLDSLPSFNTLLLHLLLIASLIHFCFDPLTVSPIISSAVFTPPLLLSQTHHSLSLHFLSRSAVFCSILYFRLPVNIFWFSPSCHASFRTSSSFSFPFTYSPSTFYFSASHPTQFPIPERHVSKWSSGKQNLDKAQRSACQSLPSVHLFVCLCSPRSLPVPSIPPTLVSG